MRSRLENKSALSGPRSMSLSEMCRYLREVIPWKCFTSMDVSLLWDRSKISRFVCKAKCHSAVCLSHSETNPDFQDSVIAWNFQTLVGDRSQKESDCEFGREQVAHAKIPWLEHSTLWALHWQDEGQVISQYHSSSPAGQSKFPSHLCCWVRHTTRFSVRHLYMPVAGQRKPATHH